VWFGLVVVCPLKKVSKIILDEFESTHYSLNRFNEVSDFMWIDSHILESIYVWIVSQKSLTYTESIHKYIWIDSFLSGFTWNNSITLWIDSFFLLYWVCFLISESIHPFSESILFVLFVQKLCLSTPHYIFSSSHKSKIIESFAIIVHTFFKMKLFLRITFFFECIDSLGY